ncbi:transposase [Patiriisocius sp. Uisw_017]|jgi:transposase|uniref:transposase n=1 Tax=Patiriisocius sp. Uisw_017 TaxID=3230968 RepID=UPI0039EC011D
MLLIENEMPINKAAKILGIYPNKIWTFFNYWISRAHSADTIDLLEQVGFDETSTRKGHHYVTTMVDLNERRVLYAFQGKDSDCIRKRVVYLEEKEVDVNKVKQVCIDISPAFKIWLQQLFTRCRHYI